MEKSKYFTAGVLLFVLIFGMFATGCTTTHHGIEIDNVRNVRELYIKNAGTNNWGSNLAGSSLHFDRGGAPGGAEFGTVSGYLQRINKSHYSETVDIKVVDTNGIVYTKFNVKFNDESFVETKKIKTANIYFWGVLAIGALAAIGYTNPNK